MAACFLGDFGVIRVRIDDNKHIVQNHYLFNMTVVSPDPSYTVSLIEIGPRHATVAVGTYLRL